MVAARKTGVGYKRGQPFSLKLASIGGGRFLRPDAAGSINRLGMGDAVYSAFRTMPKQRALWKQYGAPRAARPGYSDHQAGVAIDALERAWDTLASSGEWVRPLASEPWHWVYVGRPGSDYRGGSKGAGWLLGLGLGLGLGFLLLGAGAGAGPKRGLRRGRG